MQYEELRQKYTDFYYHGFSIEEDEKQLRVTYDFEIKNLSHFHPTFTLAKPDAESIAHDPLICGCAFSLGMVELISYWKISCPPHVHVCCALEEDQVRWWKKLYFNGLGEFFYKNGIQTNEDDFMDLAGGKEVLPAITAQKQTAGNLIAVGGGKDSFVTMDLLKEEKEHNHAFVINKVMSAIHSAQAAGYTGEKLINPTRTLDPAMLALNKQGYLNGHTPFSAMAAFAGYLSAAVWHKKYIVLSNESSANESTVKGSKVNHQYSKTFEFEQDFNAYVKKYLPADIHYFSMLRPLSELQIAGIFATLKPYHAIFRSCNVGQKEEKWCGHCAKCLFVCIMMTAFLDEEEVVSIFGRNMLADPEMKELFEELTGMQDNKPFECVGTRDEVNIAVAMGIHRYEKSGKNLPALYAFYKETPYYHFYQGRSVDWHSYNEQNLLPEHFAVIVKAKLKEMSDESGKLED